MSTAGIFTPGGMRVAFTSGVLEGARLEPRHFDALYGASSSASLTAFFAALQLYLTRGIWTNDLTSRDVYDLMRAFRRGQRPADVDHLVDVCCGGLNVHAAINSGVKLYISVFRLKDGETRYVQATEANLTDLLKTTLCIPGIARPRLFDGELCADGGMVHTLPIRRAHDDGHDKIIVFDNRPMRDRVRHHVMIGATLLSIRHPGSWRSIFRRSRAYCDAIDFAKRPPEGSRVLYISPEYELPGTFLSRSPAAVERNYDLGVAVGKQRRYEIIRFLEA